MKKQLIVTESLKVITTESVSREIYNKGAILVYDKEDTVIGSIIYFSDTYILQTYDSDDEDTNLHELIKRYSKNYSFYYIS